VNKSFAQQINHRHWLNLADRARQQRYRAI